MKGRYYAILIGNSDFPDDPRIGKLNCPLNDVQGLKSALESKSADQYENVIVLQNQSSQSIQESISKTLNALNPNDLILIYYSGHGKMSSANTLCLATSNTNSDILEATSLPFTMLKLIVDAADVNNVVIILDCCFSGAARRTLVRSEIDDQLRVAMQGQGKYIITASTELQVAEEKESEEYSIFTKHLINGLASGDADYDCKGWITADDLYAYTREKVRQESKMSPTRFADVVGDIVISLSDKTKEPDETRLISTVCSGLLNYLDWAHNLHASFSDHVKTILMEKQCLEGIVKNATDYNEQVTDLLPKLVAYEMEINKLWGRILADDFHSVHMAVRNCHTQSIKRLNDIREVINPLFGQTDPDLRSLEKAEQVRRKTVMVLGKSLRKLDIQIENFVTLLRQQLDGTESNSKKEEMKHNLIRQAR